MYHHLQTCVCTRHASWKAAMVWTVIVRERSSEDSEDSKMQNSRKARYTQLSLSFTSKNCIYHALLKHEARVRWLFSRPDRNAAIVQVPTHPSRYTKTPSLCDMRSPNPKVYRMRSPSLEGRQASKGLSGLLAACLAFTAIPTAIDDS